ncbi:MAG: hypothetical protein J6S24_06095, partial [Lentisphaeria bacterium]|nr:hypothetical protein [Lentisphaeria bacterium]
MEKYSARHCLRRNLAVHYAANNSVQHTPNAKHRRKHPREFARKRKKYTCFATYAKKYQEKKRTISPQRTACN